MSICQPIDDIIRRAMRDPSRSDIWFAWYPVRYSALGTGSWVWLRKVWRNRCAGVTIYQSVQIIESRQWEETPWDLTSDIVAGIEAAKKAIERER